MMETYLDCACQGEHRWRSYILGAILILFIWQIAGGLIAVTLAVLLREPGMTATAAVESLKDPFKGGAVRGAIVLLPMMLLGLASVFLVVRRIHLRTLVSLITPGATVAWKRVFLGFGLWFGIISLTSLGRFALAPSDHSLSLDLSRFLPFLVMALVVVPIQTSFEELFFRGYLLQAASLASRRTIFLVFVSGFLFMLPHLVNPEAVRDPIPAAVYFFLIGALLAWWSVRDGTIELALGVHAANNLFNALVLSFEGSVLSTPTIFYREQFNMKHDLAELVVAGVVFTALVQIIGGRSSARQGEPEPDLPRPID